MIISAASSMTTSTHDPEQIWAMVSGQLRLGLDSTVYALYVRDARPLGFDGSVFRLAAPGEYARAWLESRLTRTVEGLLGPLVGGPTRVEFLWEGQRGEETAKPIPSVSQDSAFGRRTQASSQPVSQEAGSVRKSNGTPQVVKEIERTGTERNSARPTDTTVTERRPAKPMGPAGDAPAPTTTPVPASLPPGCESIELDETTAEIEAALQNRGRIVSFPRYELRFIPLVGPEYFFLRLAFLQMRFLHTTPEGRGQPFSAPVEALLQWANVGRATLHRFKNGDPARGAQPAAGWFGIEQLPGAPRKGPVQPPCRFRLQTATPLTPMDADVLRQRLAEAGLYEDPLGALQRLYERPLAEILPFPPPAPSEAQRRQKAAFLSVASVVQSMLGSQRIPAEQRAEFQERLARLNDHITQPGQLVFVSWYFLQEWLPQLGHDAAALILAARAQGYYNPQTHELRDEVAIPGGYAELAGWIGLKRQRTIADWLPNLFERSAASAGAGGADSEKWQREQQRMRTAQEQIGQFIQVVPGSRRKAREGHYTFHLHVEIAAEPLTTLDTLAARWVREVLAACEEQGVLSHLRAWVTSPEIARRAGIVNDSDQNDGAGILTPEPAGANVSEQNDGWGILPMRRAAYELTARESSELDEDGWGILEGILNDGAGILGGGEMTAGELFKRLWRLNPFWKTIPENHSTSEAARVAAPQAAPQRVVAAWEWDDLLKRNGGSSLYRQRIAAVEKDARKLVSWLCYAYSFNGQGIKDPFGWALARLKEQPAGWAEGVYSDLARMSPPELSRLLLRHIETGSAPADLRWRQAFRDAPLARLRELALRLGVSAQTG